MGSVVSSVDDLCVCGADRGAHKIIHSHVFTQELEPQGSGDSSPGECRTCGHHGSAHLVREINGQRGCQWQMLDYEIEDRVICPCEEFVPADAETAEPECTCIREGGCCHAPGVCLHGCRQAADELSDEHREPEAPEKPCIECGRTLTLMQSWYAKGAKGPWCSRCAPNKGWLTEPAPPRRPPYAVAYALASGELYEVALPGDAVATVEHGVLKISHPQGVAHIIQIRPMETT